MENRTSDPTKSHAYRGHAAGPAPVTQWLGLFLAPAAFFVHLQVGYLLVLRDCGRDGGQVLVHLAALAAVLLAAAGLWAAWVTWVRAGGEKPGDDGGPAPRTRLIAATGLGVSAVFVLILATQLVAGFIVHRCQ